MLDALTLLLTICAALFLSVLAGYGAIVGLLRVLGRRNARREAPPAADLQTVTPST